MIAFSATFRSLKKSFHLTSPQPLKIAILAQVGWSQSILPATVNQPTPRNGKTDHLFFVFVERKTWSTQSSSTWVLEEGYPVILGDSWRLQKQLICLSLCFSLAHIKMQTSLIPVPSLQTLIWEHLENPSFTGKLQGHPLHLFSRHLQKWPCVILKAQHLQ